MAANPRPERSLKKLDRPILSGLDWNALDALVRAQQINRERYTPTVSLFRWWARRPHSLIGALLDAAADGHKPEDLVVSDPFSGGGTVAVEAIRRGMRVYAQDLHPWATSGLAATLEEVDPDELQNASDEITQNLKVISAELYGSSCPTHGNDSVTVHAFWVQVRSCPSCAHDVYLFPYSLVTVASRVPEEPSGWFGCSACGEVTRSSLATFERRCRGCHRRLGDEDRSLLTDRQATCLACRQTFACFDADEEATWKLALVQRGCQAENGSVLHFDVPTDLDFSASLVEPEAIPEALRGDIPEGVETSLLRRAGFHSWSDLYPSRQITSMMKALYLIEDGDYADAVKRRLSLAVAGAAEMAGYVCRWDRFYPKAFEAMANHRFAVVGVGAEVNLLGARGRGTLPRRFAASVKAARWTAGVGIRRMAARARANKGRKVNGSTSVVVCGSSEKQAIQDDVVDLVLTDPPYFDDVQYSELAAVLSVWGEVANLVDGTWLNLRREAVPNQVRGTTGSDYQEILTNVFIETRRTMKPGGRMLLTFHNRDIVAWHSLAAALHKAQFSICALAVAHAENGTDHAKRGLRSFTKDLVLECAVENSVRPRVARRPTDDQERELIAAGKTLAKAGDCDLDVFAKTLEGFSEGLKDRRISLSRAYDTIRAG